MVVVWRQCILFVRSFPPSWLPPFSLSSSLSTPFSFAPFPLLLLLPRRKRPSSSTKATCTTCAPGLSATPSVTPSDTRYSISTARPRSPSRRPSPAPTCPRRKPATSPAPTDPCKTIILIAFVPIAFFSDFLGFFRGICLRENEFPLFGVVSFVSFLENPNFGLIVQNNWVISNFLQKLETFSDEILIFYFFFHLMVHFSSLALVTVLGRRRRTEKERI